MDANPPYNGAANSGAHTPGDGATTTGAQNGYPDANTGAMWQGELSDEHRHVLEVESAIAPDVITKRGYFTCNDPALLRQHGFTKAQALKGALVVPLWNCDGERAGVAIRHTVARNTSTKNGIKYDVPQGAAMTLDISPATLDLLKDKSIPIIGTEGAKKADSAATNGFPAINLNGVWGFVSKGVPLPDWEKLRPYLHGRTFLIAYDSDAARKWGVELAMRRLETLLKSMNAKVKVIYFDDAPNGSKIGLDDFFANGGTVEKMWELARDLEPVEESKRKRKEKERAEKRAQVEADAASVGAVVIETASRQLKSILGDLSQAVGDYNKREKRLFHAARGLSHITHDKDGFVIIGDAGVEVVQDVASRAAHWIATSERDGIRDVFPSREVCKIFAVNRSNWCNIPPLDTIATAPFFDAQGKLCGTRGYHESAQIFLDLPESFQLPDTAPTPENVADAKHLILETLLGEVAFLDDASRAHAVALMLLPYIRRMIPDCTPLHVFDAPIQSSGKSYAAEICISAFAEPAPMDDISDEAEWAKSIFSTLLEGRVHLFFDNIKSRLSSASLASYITSPTKSGRILGVSQKATVSTRGAVWVATSNNAKLDADAASRSLLIRLDTGLERPEDKPYNGDPKAFIKANLEKVAGALITLVNHWAAQGKPMFTARKHRFAAWSRIVGGILEANQIHGFLDNLDATRENLAPEVEAWRQFVQLWFEKLGDNSATAKNLLPIALECAQLSEIIGEKDGQVKRLGEHLGRRRDQIFANFKISRDPQKSKDGVKWCLIPQFDPKKAQNEAKRPENGDTGDTGDTFSNPRTRDRNFSNNQEKVENTKLFNNLHAGNVGPEKVSPVSPVSPETEAAGVDI